MEGLHHEQCLTESAGALPQHLVRFHGDDGAQGEDERVDVLHVQVVGCHGIGDGVIGQPLVIGREGGGGGGGGEEALLKSTLYTCTCMCLYTR